MSRALFQICALAAVGGTLLVASGCTLTDPCGTVVDDAEQLDRVRRCTELPALHVQGHAPSVIDLPNLEKVGEIEIYDNGALTEVRLPALRTVDGPYNMAVSSSIAFWNNPSLQRVDLGSLGDGGDPDLWVDVGLGFSGERLTEVRLDSLSFARSLGVHESALEELVLPNAAFRHVEIWGNPDLAEVDLALGDPMYADRFTEGSFHVTGNASLEAFTLSGDIGTGGASQVNSIEENPALTSIDLPDLVEAGQLQIDTNGSLSTLDAPGLEQLTALQVTGNASLPDCEAWAIVDQIEAAGNEVDAEIHGNQTDACTE